DLAIIDPEREVTVAPDLLLSAQPYTPFAGKRLRGWVTHTVLRGRLVYEAGRVTGSPTGESLRRPIAVAA
ncbi:MAG TPA: dihydropyrimidinase, partial [Candidatus Limnocylindria bacterium]|nr:dihydropyrimidinase [Candidatus Limnocylindria bacterium]